MAAIVSRLFAAMHAHGVLPSELRIVLELQSTAAPGRRLTAALGDDVAAAVDRFRRVGGASVTTANGLNSAWQIGTNLSFEAPLEAIDEIASHQPVLAVRPARLHVPQLIDVAALHEIYQEPDSRPTGRGVKIAVIDSGIDRDHPAFLGRIDAASRNLLPGEPAEDLSDTLGHGTHVAGIIAGDGPRFRGLAPEATLLIVKVFDGKGRADEGVVAQAIQYAVDHGADVVNFSGGYAPVFKGIPVLPAPWVWRASEFKEERALRFAAAEGVLGVVAAGNHGAWGRGTVTLPAISPHCLAVGALSKRNALSSFSSWGPSYRSEDLDLSESVLSLAAITKPVKASARPHLVAVGGEVGSDAPCPYMTGIVSAASRHCTSFDHCRLDEDRDYMRMAGTSQAAPVVSALAGLVIERLNATAGRPRHQADRRTRLRQVRQIVLQACVSVDVPRRTWKVGAGLPKWSAIEAALGRHGGN